MAEKFEPGEWPRDPHGYVFLGRAFDRVGSATFKAEWTNLEKTVSRPMLLPEGMPQRSSAADLAARDLLHTHVPEFKARLSRLVSQQRAATVVIARNASRSTGPGASRGPFPDQAEVAQAKRTLQLTDALTADEWRTARELNKKSFELAKPEWDRAVTVRETVIAGFERGSLNAFTREKAGGEMKPMPPEWWNTDRAFDRFIHGDVDTRNPFSVWRGAAGMSWIFVSEQSLAKHLADFSAHLNPTRVGAPEKYDWEEARLFAVRELNNQGDFLDPQNKTKGWKSQNDLVEKIIVHLEKFSETGEAPSPSAVKSKVRDWLREWRESSQ